MFKAAIGQWHKLAAIIVDRYGEVEITPDGHRHVVVKIDSDDVERLAKSYSGEQPTIVVIEKEKVLYLIVEPESDALRRLHEHRAKGKSATSSIGPKHPK